jgi:hypothetical protein
VAWVVDFEDHTPAYPAYLHDDRLAGYTRHHGHRHVQFCRGSTAVDRWAQPVRDADSLCLRWSLPTHTLSAVLVASDGLTSFRRDHVPVDATSLVPSLTAFKTRRGAFLQRRARRFLRRTCPAQGYRHHDDLALGAIVL